MTVQALATTVPQRLYELAGHDAADLAASTAAVLWTGIVENAGGETIYFRRSIAAPNPLTDIGRRLPTRSRLQMREYSGRAEGPYWLWTARNAATVMIDAGALE